MVAPSYAAAYGAFDSVEACHMLSRYVSLTRLEIKQRLRLGDDDLVRYVRA